MEWRSLESLRGIPETAKKRVKQSIKAWKHIKKIKHHIFSIFNFSYEPCILNALINWSMSVHHFLTVSRLRGYLILRIRYISTYNHFHRMVPNGYVRSVPELIYFWFRYLIEGCPNGQLFWLTLRVRGRSIRIKVKTVKTGL